MLTASMYLVLFFTQDCRKENGMVSTLCYPGIKVFALHIQTIKWVTSFFKPAVFLMAIRPDQRLNE